MKIYVVRVYDTVATYDIKAGNKKDAEKKAVERYKKEKDDWIGPLTWYFSQSA